MSFASERTRPSGATPSVTRCSRHPLGQGAPLRYGVGEPVGELPGFVADDHPAQVVTDDSEVEEIPKLLLQLLVGQAVMNMLGHESSTSSFDCASLRRTSASTTASLCSVSRAP